MPMAPSSLAAATQQVKLLVGMATNKSKVDAVPENGKPQQQLQQQQQQQSKPAAAAKSAEDPQKAPATKRKKKSLVQAKQFPEDLRGQQPRLSNGGKKKKGTTSRKSSAVQQQQQQPPQQEQQQEEQQPPAMPPRTSKGSKHKRTVSSSSAPAVTDANKASSLSRQLTKEKEGSKRGPPKTRGSHIVKATAEPKTATTTGRKRSSSLDESTTNEELPASPTPPESKAVRKNSATSKKGRATSLKNAVQASKHPSERGKASSLKTALAASKQQAGGAEPNYVRKLSINSDSKAIRKASPAGKKRKESLKSKKTKEQEEKVHTKQSPSTEFMLNEAAELDTSARSTASVQRRKNSFKAKSEIASKHPPPSEFVISEGVALDTSARSTSSAKKRKDSLKARGEKTTTKHHPPSSEFVIIEEVELDTSARSASSAKKRKDSLKARKMKDQTPKQPMASNVDLALQEAKELDTSTRSTSSIKSLPANVGSAKKEKMKQQYQSPQVSTKPKLSSRALRKTPHPQSTQGAATKSKRSQSMQQKSNPRPASLSPKRHSNDKVHDISQEMDSMMLSFNLSTGDDLSVGDLDERPTKTSRKRQGRMEGSLGNMSAAAADPLLGIRPPRPKTPDLETQLESQRLLDEGVFHDLTTDDDDDDDDDPPKKRNSDTSITISSTLTLASRLQENEPILTAQSERDVRVTHALEAIKEQGQSPSGLSASTSQMSTYAGDIATPTRLAPRPSLAPNMLINSHGHGQGNGSKSKPAKQAPPKKVGSLTFFGNPIVPIDIVEQTKRPSKLNLMHHKDAIRVLEQIKHMKREQLKVKVYSINSSAGDLPAEKSTNSVSQQEEQPELKALQLLKTAGTSTSATVSMTGFKGGDLEKQINHDRSLIVSPFYLRNHGSTMVKRRLMGVFDGHAVDGSKFAEHCQQLLPSLLSRKLSEAFKRAVDDIAAGIKREDEVAITRRVLIDAFLTMDESAPHGATGGCTATVVYQQGQKIFVANTGDSRSCIIVYRRNVASRPPVTHQAIEVNGASKTSLITICEGEDSIAKPVKVVYISREDKPDLPEERARLEEWGGEIIEAEGNKSAKVKFHGERLGKATATLSMSRSIGDSQFTDLGVIADPIVDVLDLQELLEHETATTASSPDGEDTVDDICVFALCASDGMMIESIGDAEDVASELAPSLFNDDGPHPLTACQSVIVKSASVWDRRNKGKFRDDITVAVTVLRTPPAT